MTIVQNVASVASNWEDDASGHAVSIGKVYSGHHDNSPANSLDASTDNDPYYGTGDIAPSLQKRTLVLNNGEVIWDFSGNVSEWTSGQTTNQAGVLGELTYSTKQWPLVNTLGSLTIDSLAHFSGKMDERQEHFNCGG